MRMAFVDLETTGATASVDRITEVGVVEFDAEHPDEVSEWSSLVNPETRIPEFIERLTGISNAMVAGAPTFADIAEGLRERLEGRLFVAHNARFDYGFLKAEFARREIPFRPTVLCTVKLSRRLFPGERKHNLDSLITRQGLVIDQRHRALGDARAIADFWRKVRPQTDPDQWAAVVKELTARPALPPHLGAETIDELPEGPGVYLFYGDNDLPLYVGKSKTLRRRILAHFAADTDSAKEMSLSQQVRRIDCIETAGEIGALLLEARLVKQLLPTHNRQLRRNTEMCAWQWDPVAGNAPHLAYASDLGFGSQGDLYGLFGNARDARRALQALADEHGLCHALLGLEKLAPGRPCFAYQLHKCRGACVGKESLLNHGARVAAALARLKLLAWPFRGPALLREGGEVHLVDAWCYLGTARSEDELDGLLESGRPVFDKDTYQILRKVVAKMVPLDRSARGADA